MSIPNPTERLAEISEISEPGDRLLALRALERELADLALEARLVRKATIAELRGAGLTWRVIGDLLGGITPQAAEQLG